MSILTSFFLFSSWHLFIFSLSICFHYFLYHCLFFFFFFLFFPSFSCFTGSSFCLIPFSFFSLVIMILLHFLTLGCFYCASWYSVLKAIFFFTFLEAISIPIQGNTFLLDFCIFDFDIYIFWGLNFIPMFSKQFSVAIRCNEIFLDFNFCFDFCYVHGFYVINGSFCFVFSFFRHIGFWVFTSIVLDILCHS